METKKMENEHIRMMKKCYEMLQQDETAHFSIISIIGDMEEGVNHSLFIGDKEKLVLTLAQQMVNDIDFLHTVKESLQLVESYAKHDDEKKQEDKPKLLS